MLKHSDPAGADGWALHPNPMLSGYCSIKERQLTGEIMLRVIVAGDASDRPAYAFTANMLLTQQPPFAAVLLLPGTFAEEAGDALPETFPTRREACRAADAWVTRHEGDILDLGAQVQSNLPAAPDGGGAEAAYAILPPDEESE